MLPSVGSIFTGATGRMAAAHIRLSHGFNAVLWHRQWNTHFSYQLLTTYRVFVRLYAVCCQGLRRLWTPLASLVTWFCATLCWTVVKISHLLADHFPHNGCFSFSNRLYSEGLRSQIEGGCFSTLHSQCQRTLLTVSADWVVTLSCMVIALSTASGHFCLTAWCGWYCRWDIHNLFPWNTLAIVCLPKWSSLFGWQFSQTLCFRGNCRLIVQVSSCDYCYTSCKWWWHLLSSTVEHL